MKTWKQFTFFERLIKKYMLLTSVNNINKYVLNSEIKIIFIVKKDTKIKKIKIKYFIK